MGTHQDINQMMGLLNIEGAGNPFDIEKVDFNWVANTNDVKQLKKAYTAL